MAISTIKAGAKILASLYNRILTDNISFLAGGIAFYGLLAMFPAMAAVVSIFGLTANPYVVVEQLEGARPLFPPQVYQLLYDQLNALLAAPDVTLSLTAVFSTLLAAYAAMRGTKAMLSALNMVFGLRETRGWWRRQIIAAGLTVGALMILCLAFITVIAVPVMIQFLPPVAAEQLATAIDEMRWLILGAAMLGGLVLLFAIGPSRPLSRVHWPVTVLGAFVASALWLSGAAIGSYFVQRMPNFQAAYGSLSAVTALMVWMVGSAYAILIGAGIVAAFDGRAITRDDEL